MSNSTSSNKKSARQLLKERQAEMAAEIARLEVDARREAEEEEHKRKEAEEERKHVEEQKRKDLEETRKALAEHKWERLMKARADNALESSGPADPEVACEMCVTRRKACTWAVASKTPRIQTCDQCRASKEKCVSGNPPAKAPASKGKGKKRARPEGPPSPKGKGKQRQKSPEDIDNDMEILSSPQTVIGEEQNWTEYDDQAWVVVANNIVAELARTNGLLERGIGAAEGSRAAMDWVSETMLRFMEEQREFQNLFLEGVRTRFRMNVEDSPEEEITEGAEKEAGRSGGDMEMDS
ncbi:hypothetical protein C8R48DRAFT_773657 [Suillus tomentosus]|nr:hypothetical protein C8R48DRAFT_773657 [Suillus tomentosus]